MLTDGEGSAGDVDDQEVTDECAMLIHTDHINKHIHVKNGQDKSSGSTYSYKSTSYILLFHIEKGSRILFFP